MLCLPHAEFHSLHLTQFCQALHRAHKKKPEDLTSDEKKLLSIYRKQDRLLYLCFYLLLNLAEDVSIEKKMKKRNIVLYLCKMLERKNVELLILSVTFLKKLSIFQVMTCIVHSLELLYNRKHSHRLDLFIPCPS